MVRLNDLKLRTQGFSSSPADTENEPGKSVNTLHFITYKLNNTVHLSPDVKFMER